MLQIEEKTDDPVINISLDTLRKKKQLLSFFNTKKSAEACAERIFYHIDKKEETPELEELGKKIEKVLSSPTKQCRRLAKVIRRGIAFHHSGLHSEQRAIIEENFRAGKIKIICSTTTLGAGLDLPAFRVIIKDLKRFSGGWGMSSIPVLEYEQMAGRAGRPSYDNEGQAICIADSVEEQEEIWEQYINGYPEDILSKLAVEPIMRTYVLSLIATGYAKSINSINEFMGKTFYAHQYKDVSRLRTIVSSIVKQLEEWEFINILDGDEKKQDKSGFLSAKSLSKQKDAELKGTKLGERIAELYLDPSTAHYILECMKRGASKELTPFALLQMVCWTLELRPLLTTRKKDLEIVDEKLVLEEDNLLCEIPDQYSDEFDDFSDSIKTALVLERWTEEISEEKLLEDFNITPGELNSKLERTNWLLYSSYELSKIQGFKTVGREILKLKERVQSGVKEELLPLIRLKGIGRVRARKMFNNRIRDLGDVKKVDVSILGALIGDKLAYDVKKQVGQELTPEKVQVKQNKRKGQISLNDYGEEE